MEPADQFLFSPKTTDNRSLTWYLICRTAVITFLLGGASVFYLKGTVDHGFIQPLFVLIGVSYAEALVSAIILKNLTKTFVFAQVQIVWDLLFVTALILMSGGVDSVFSFAYLLVIVWASFLFSRRLTVLAAASATILFGGILDLQYFHYLHSFDLYRTVSDGNFFSVLFVHSVAFFLTAVLSGTLAERWRKSEAQLQKKSIDYAELEKMNRTILAHISSGLMLVNPQGRIRSFNRAATDITGFSLQDVYDQDAGLFFPEFAGTFSPQQKKLSRAEGRFQNKLGKDLILGYATTTAKGPRGENLGTLVTFQDLTEFKKIEEDLMRADRLAAVGRLAAGMAHEIRNPLASISGSVQLLMEAEHVKKDDLHLMKIVVKEADRLNHLLTEFLTFARPNIPIKEKMNISEMLVEFEQMLKSDARFNGIEVRLTKPSSEVFLSLDKRQLCQVLWNLAINAAEAMNGQGALLLMIDPGLEGETKIIIEDSGPGIDESISEKIFEPFFSTKDHGTGLGLAAVYSIIEVHSGTVHVERSELGGARFILQFEG